MFSFHHSDVLLVAVEAASIWPAATPFGKANARVEYANLLAASVGRDKFLRYLSLSPYIAKMCPILLLLSNGMK